MPFRIIFLFLVALFLSFQPTLAEEADSLSVTSLDELVVKARNVHAIENGFSYIPTRNEKRSARNAQDLLLRMGITQLNVNPLTLEVKSLSGDEVLFCVNGFPENPAVVWTMEVKEVQVLTSPPDLKYGGAKYVVNYIVEKYVYGGYTRIGMNETVSGGLKSAAGLFSRFQYKDLTLDFFTSPSLSNLGRHDGSLTTQQFSLLDDSQRPYLLSRTESANTDSFRDNFFPFTLTMSYTRNNMRLTIPLAFNYSSNDARMTGRVSYTAEDYPVGMATGGNDYNDPTQEAPTLTFNDGNAHSIFFGPNMFLQMGKGWAMNLKTNFSWDFNRGYYGYENTFSGLIDNNSREDAFNYRIDLSFSKSFKAHMLSLGIVSRMSSNRIEYLGSSSGKDRITVPSERVSLRYNFSNRKFFASLSAIYGMEFRNNNGSMKSFPNFQGDLVLAFIPNGLSQLVFSGDFYRDASYSLANLSDVPVRQNDILYRKGNPGLRMSNTWVLSLSYSFFPSPYFNFSVYSDYIRSLKLASSTYERYDDGKALLQTFDNRGNSTKANINFSVGSNLLDGKLRFNLTGSQNFFRSPAIFPYRHNYFNMDLSGYFYAGQFWVSAGYRLPVRSNDERQATKSKNPQSYFVMGGWGNDNWKVSLTLANIFNRGWESGRSRYESDLFSSHTLSYSNAFHSTVTLGVSYTFGYGKKLDRSGEAAVQKTGESAIIKM